MYINYGMLNKSTYIDAYPIHCIDDIIDRLSRAILFIKMDLYQSYHEI